MNSWSSRKDQEEEFLLTTGYCAFSKQPEKKDQVQMTLDNKTDRWEKKKYNFPEEKIGQGGLSGLSKRRESQRKINN